ncbi:hypothetical protein HS088_TW18G00709 [Tripterygium wilfordii]|uniref:NAC domain-containing protein n=1 Tax=Tripterygium wilfordii TaxID=458696 RepID=A0A7J7CCY6_TRIWF|nr:protein NTM1-like 9 [Tripterygium wilfordii]KAF5732021.1 hypothetical protein HS088_TW18G00709 [Tripterygium wilfordii]
MDRVGYRFHPTEVELIDYFLKNKMLGHELKVRRIAEVDVCKFEPWDLPEHCATDSKNRSWYFFSRPIYKYSNSKRANRKTKAGYWKVTGKKRNIKDRANKVIGTKWTLVFYEGRSPKGIKTNWVIHEYHPNSISSNERDFVVCRLKRKHGGKINSCTQNEGETSSNHHSTSGIGSCIVDSSSPEVNLELLAKSSSPTGYNGQGVDSAGHSQNQIEQNPENSPCDTCGLVSQDDNSVLVSQVDTFEQEDDLTALANSFLVDKDDNHVLVSQVDPIEQEDDPTALVNSFLVDKDDNSVLESQVETIEQEDDLTALVNSFLVDDDEFIGEGNEDTHPHDSRPLKSLSSVDVDQTDKDIDTEMVY